jgi:hypothetical protein
VSAGRVVGVAPAAALSRSATLFAALAEAFPTIRFEGREPGGLGGLDALVELGGTGAAEAAAASGVPALALLNLEAPAGRAEKITLGAAPSLDRRLRGRTLTDHHLGAPAPLPVPAGAAVLAEGRGGPLWTRTGRLDVASSAPVELGDDEQLRMRLRGGRCLALLPLLELLRGLEEGEGWQPPPPRATFLLDDPNLHWPSYGFVNLRELAEHGDRHGYHLALAMVPLDGWFAHPEAASLVRERRSLSLLVHGNDHLAHELGRADGAALALAAQAQRRIAAFERRGGLGVSRVMAPPHEACSEAIARALPRTGFEAVTMTRPFPWLARRPDEWLAATPQAGRLAGWHPADLTPTGLPVMLRHPLGGRGHSPDELVLRAYLDQPLILYGHQADLADGLDLLAELAADVGRLGPVSWGSLAALAATNLERRREGECLRVRPYGRRVEVDVPAGVSTLIVERPPGSVADDTVRGPAASVRFGEPLAVTPGERVELNLVAADAVSPASVSGPRPRAWPVARRIAAEARDRAAPLRRRVAVPR